MADEDGATDVVDLSGNGKGVALNVFPNIHRSLTDLFDSVEQFGFKMDGGEHTDKLQDALDAASTDPKVNNQLLVPPGRIEIGSIVKPDNVSLVGLGSGPYEIGVDPSTTDMLLPVILCVGTTAPAVSCTGYGGLLENLLFYYPDQVAPTVSVPVVYPPTVRFETQGGGFGVRNCSFVNSYDAIDILVGRCFVESCKIGALRYGINVNQALDFTDIRNVQNQVFWTIVKGLPGGQPLDEWAQSNGIALRSGRADSLRVSNFEVFRRYAAFEFYLENAPIDGGYKAGYGNIDGAEIDYVAYGIIAHASNTAGDTQGYSFSNANFRANASGGVLGQKFAQLNAGAPAGYEPKIRMNGGGVYGTWAVGHNRPDVLGGSFEAFNVDGINNLGVLPTPAVPATTVPLKNPYPHKVNVGIAMSGGTISNLTIDGSGTGLLGANQMVPLLANQTIAVTYTGSMTWAWFSS